MSTYSWVVLNQSQSPSFQKLLGQLSERLGPCLLITGMPHPNDVPSLTIDEGPKYVRTSKGARLRSWAAFMAYATRRVARIPGQPFVLSVTNPPTLPHLGYLLTRLRGWQSGILVWDLYPEHIVQQGWLKEHNPIVRMWMGANKRAYKAASCVISLGAGMAAAIREQADENHSIVEIPNWADTELLRPIDKDKNSFALEHCKSNAVTVLYSGNLGASHNLDSLLLAAKELSHVPELEFLIIGEGLRATEIQSHSKELGLTNFKLLPYQAWDTLPRSLAVGDIAVVSQETGTEHLSVPSKTYSALAVGSAILALTAKGSDLGNLVVKHKVGAVCKQDDVSEICASIMRFVNDRELLRQTQTQSRKTSEEFYSERVIEKQFLDAIGPLVSPS